MAEVTAPQTQGVENQPEPEAKTFEPITTQEELDKISAQIRRADEARYAKKYADYDALKEKAAKFDEFQESQKSEIEKANERAAKAETELSTLRAELERSKWASEVSAETGVPASLIRGATREEMADYAAQLVAFKGEPKPQGYPPTPSSGIPANNVDSDNASSELDERLRKAAGLKPKN